MNFKSIIDNHIKLKNELKLYKEKIKNINTELKDTEAQLLELMKQSDLDKVIYTDKCFNLKKTTKKQTIKSKTLMDIFKLVVKDEDTISNINNIIDDTKNSKIEHIEKIYCTNKKTNKTLNIKPDN